MIRKVFKWFRILLVLYICSILKGFILTSKYLKLYQALEPIQRPCQKLHLHKSKTTLKNVEKFQMDSKSTNDQ